MTYDVTENVRSWYNGTANRGFALKRAGGTNSSVLLVSREKIQKYAQLTISYSGSHFADGVYAIRNASNGVYLKSSIPQSLGWVLQDTTHTVPPLESTNLENLFKIAYRTAQSDYVIRSMLDNSVVMFPELQNMAPLIQRRTENNAAMSVNYTWNIVRSDVSTVYFYITFTKNGTTYYAYSPSNAHNSAIKLTTDKAKSGTLWSFAPYTGNVIEKVVGENISYVLDVGDVYNYKAYMRSTRIQHNGPVTYSVKDADGTATTRATINATTGALIAIEPGVVVVRATYSGSPWYWGWTIKIVLPCSGYEIDYNPSAWNNVSNIKERSNCYNYALNIPNSNDVGLYWFMQPGRMAGLLAYTDEFLGYNEDNVRVYYRRLIGGSGFVTNTLADASVLGRTISVIGKNEECPPGSYKVALVLDLYDEEDYINGYGFENDLDGLFIFESPDMDFHWYRQNPDGSWSHKTGNADVTNYDASGNVIYDPETCDKDYGGYNYDDFIVFFSVSSNE